MIPSTWYADQLYTEDEVGKLMRIMGARRAVSTLASLSLVAKILGANNRMNLRG